MKKKLLNLMLVMAMVLSLIPAMCVTASAEGNVCKIGTVEYASVTDALKHGGTDASDVPGGENAGAPTEIVMINDSEEQIEIPAGRYIKLDLAGKTISSDGTTIENYGNLAVCDTSVGHSGKICAVCEDAFVAAIANENVLNVTGGTISAEGEAGYINTIYTKDATTTEISGDYTTVIAKNLDDCDAVVAVYSEAGGVTNINGGVFQGEDAVHVETSSSTINISGGKFDGKLMAVASGKLKISGGWYTEKPTASFLVADYVVKNLVDKAPYLYEVKPLRVCKIGSKEYASIKAALEDTVTSNATAEAEGTPTEIVLIDDDVENVTIPEGRNITLNLSGYVIKAKESGSVITNNGTLKIKDSGSTVHYFKVAESGLWELQSGEQTETYTYDATNGLKKNGVSSNDIPAKDSIIAITGGCITGGRGVVASDGGGISNKGSFTLEAGNIIGNNPANLDGGQGGGVSNSGTFIMNGGCIVGNYSYHGGAGVFNHGSGTFTLNNGSISCNTSKESGGGIGNDGTFTMNAGRISNNKAGDIGGGIYNDGGYDKVLLGGSIENNIAVNKAGGVLAGSNCTLGGTIQITDNIVGSVERNLVVEYMEIPIGKAGKITIITSVSIGDGSAAPKNGMNVGVTMLDLGKNPTSGAFTTNGTEADKKYFFSDNDDYEVRLINGDTNKESTDPLYNDHLELVYVPTLYFGQNSTNPIEYSLYTDAARTKNYYTGFGTTWSVEWSAEENKPILKLNGFNSNGYKLQIDCDCIVEASGTNTISSENGNGLVFNKNTTIKGDGTLNVSSEKEDAMAVKAVATVNGATLKCSAASSDKKDITFGTSGKIKLVSGDVKDKTGESFYPETLDTLYLARSSNKDYALYTDYETCNFEYAVGSYGSEELSDSKHYAVLNLTDELNKKIIFKQYADQTYAAVLRVVGTDTKLGGFDASEGTLTVQSEAGNNILVTGDIKAQKLYMVECNGLVMSVEDGSIIAAEKEGVTNEMMIGSNSNTYKVQLIIINGGIQFEKGTITITNAKVSISENDGNGVGINAHRINLDSSGLNIEKVKTGIKLYEPKQNGEGAVLTIGNKSHVEIYGKEVGVQGTYGEGGNYFNNIAVLDTQSVIWIAGSTKAVSSVAISPIPSTKIVRDGFGKAVVFTVNDDVNYTTDYYYVGTKEPATTLSLGDITVFVDPEIKNGKITISDPGALPKQEIAVTATPDPGYELDKITAKDKDGNDITSEVLNGSTITVPAREKLPLTVSATFKLLPTPIQYAVKFDVQGHGTAPRWQTIEAGGKVKEPTDPTAKGYIFGGWFKEADCVNVWDFDNDTVNKNTTLYAKWTKEEKPVVTKELFIASGTAKGSTNTLKWNAVEGATGYEVYFTTCGKSFKKVKTTSALKYTKKGLNTKYVYKYKVRAYKLVDGKKTYIATTPVAHIAGTEARFSNATKLTVAKNKLSMAVGKTTKLGAKITKTSNNKTVLWKNHVSAKIRYKSADKSVVTVDSKGKVKAVGEGKAYVYAYAANCIYARVTVVVK